MVSCFFRLFPNKCLHLVVLTELRAGRILWPSSGVSGHANCQSKSAEARPQGPIQNPNLESGMRNSGFVRPRVQAGIRVRNLDPEPTIRNSGFASESGFWIRILDWTLGPSVCGFGLKISIKFLIDFLLGLHFGAL